MSNYNKGFFINIIKYSMFLSYVYGSINIVENHFQVRTRPNPICHIINSTNKLRTPAVSEHY